MKRRTPCVPDGREAMTKRKRTLEERCRSVYCAEPEWADGWCQVHHPDQVAARELAAERAGAKSRRKGKL